MTHTEYFIEQFLGAFVWLALLILVVMFLRSAVSSALKKHWPQTESGRLLNPDQIVTNKIFALDQNGGSRRIDGEKAMQVTVGLRGASIAIFAFAYYWYYDQLQYFGFELSIMDFILMAGIAYYIAFVWMFSLRYDSDTLWVRGWTFTVKKYDLRALDSMTETPNGSWKLWFLGGSHVEVLKFITQSATFHRDMTDRVARNVVNPRQA